LLKLVKGQVKGATVEINTERPRKGTFQVVVNGETLLSLEAMARPFSKLKGTNIEDLAEKVVEKLEGGGGGSKAKGIAPEKKSTKKTKESKSKTASQKSSKATAKAATKAAAKKAPAAKRKAPAPTVGVRRSSRIRTQK